MEVVSETGSRFDLEREPAQELIEKILSRPLFAHLATASERGPRESPVWFLWEGGALWIIGNYKTDSRRESSESHFVLSGSLILIFQPELFGTSVFAVAAIWNRMTPTG
jgi:hypothetical protein